MNPIKVRGAREKEFEEKLIKLCPIRILRIAVARRGRRNRNRFLTIPLQRHSVRKVMHANPVANIFFAFVDPRQDASVAFLCERLASANVDAGAGAGATPVLRSALFSAAATSVGAETARVVDADSCERAMNECELCAWHTVVTVAN